MRIIFLLSVSSLFLISLNFAWSQEGFDLIRKADRKIEKGKYRRALALLDRAEKSNYGFCGNAWIEAHEVIAVSRARVHHAVGNSQRAGDEINSLDLTFEINNLDSLKIAYFAVAFGKERVKFEIDSCLSALKPEFLDSFHSTYALQLPVSFSEQPILLTFGTCHAIIQSWQQFIKEEANDEKSKEDYLQSFVDAVRRQPFYQILE